MPQPDISIKLPIYVRLGKKLSERFSLNLNVYRNAHFHTLSTAKNKFEFLVAPRLMNMPVIAKADLTYRLFFGSRRTIDVSNICCIVDKFFCDTLVNQKKLVDDNMDSISNINYQWGGVNLRDPHVEVILSNIQTVEDLKPMQITLNAQELEDIIREAVLQQITIREDQGISIAFKQQGEGASAIITIQKADEATAPKKVRTRRAAQADADPVEEPAKAHVSVEELAETAKPTGSPAGTQPTSQPIFAQPGDPATIVSEKTSRIFPDVNSSAPVTEPATPPPSKSLFSNLTKPVHDTAKE